MRSMPAMTRRRSLVWRTSSPCVREAPPRYDDEGSTRTAHGAVDVGRGAWWSVALAVPVDARAPGAPAHVRMVRHGEGASRELELLLPASEVAAVAVLLAGVAAQALRDGVLPIPQG